MALIKLKKINSNLNNEEEIINDSSIVQPESERKWDNPSIVSEDDNKTEFSNLYILNDRTSKLIISAEEKNYYDEVEKKWKEIDNSFVDKGDSFVNKSGKYQTKLHKPSKGNVIEIGNDDLNLSWEYLGKKNSNSIERKSNLKLINENIKKNINKAMYENVEVDSDIEYVLSGNSLKENIIVKEKSQCYEYSFLLKTKGLKVRLSADNESIEFFKQYLNTEGHLEEKVEFIIPSPYMYDAKGETCEDVYYELNADGEDKYIFSVIASNEWINDDERQLPITIDPQIVVPSNKVITHQVQYRSISTSSSGTTYGSWINTTSSTIRVYKSSNIEYRSFVYINKSFINQMVADLSSVKLRLYPSGTFSTSFYVDGSLKSFNSASGSFTIDLTSKFSNSPGDFSILLTSYTNQVDVNFKMTVNPPVLELDYIQDENINHVIKTFNLAGIATGHLNLVDGTFATNLCDVSAENSVYALPIEHINKKCCDDNLVGNNIRLNLHEKLIKHDEINYVYEDGYGNKHIFKPYYYYFDSNNLKKYIADTSQIIVGTDKSMQIQINSKLFFVYIEYKSTTGLTALTSIDDIAQMDYLEQRTNEIKQIEEQVKKYKETLSEYVIFNVAAANIVSNVCLKNYLDSVEQFDFFYTYAEEELYYVPLTRSEAYSYMQIDIGFYDENTSTDQKQLYNKQYAIIEDEDIRLQKLHQLKTLFAEYCTLLEELERLKLETPVNYLTDDSIIKGFNSEGNLVTVFDKYDNWSNVMYEKYLDANNNPKYRISYLTDNKGNNVKLTYDNNNLLSDIIDINGHKVSYTYSNGELTKVKYDTGESVSLSYNNGAVSTITEDKNALKSEVIYSYNRPIYINNYSLINNFSVEEYTSALTLVSQIQITYSPSSTLPVSNVIIKENLTKEKYCFDSNGFNTEYYLEENGYVTMAEKYQYTPYWIGSVAQADPKRVVISASKSSLNSTNLSSYVFETGDTVTTTIDQFNKPIKQISSDIAISNGLTRSFTTTYTYDNNQQLIEESTTNNFKNSSGITVKTLCLKKKYTYNSLSSVIKIESYIVGEELTNGKNIEEIVYDENGNVIKTFTYNTLKSSDKFYSEKEFNEKGQVVATFDSLGQNKTILEYGANSNSVNTELLPNGCKLSYGYDYDGLITSITKSTSEGEENSNSQVMRFGEPVEINSLNNNVKYKYDYMRRMKAIELDGVTDYVKNTYTETKSGSAIIKTLVTSTYKNGDSIVSEYDGLNNLLKNTINGSVQVQNTYNIKRQLVKTVDSVTGNTFSFTYDDFENLTACTEVNSSGTTTKSEVNSFDTYGSISKKAISGPVSQTYIFAYKDNSVRNLDNILFNNTYKFVPLFDKNERIVGKQIYNGTSLISEEKISYLKYGDHATSIPTTISFVNSSDNVRYAYDKMGNICKVYENGELSVRYEYDALSRLIREDNKVLDKTVLIAYDNNGNIINKRGFAFTLKDMSSVEELESNDNIYTYNGDKLLSFDGENITYDGTLGRPTTYRGNTLTWSKIRQLTKYGSLVFTYDGLGRRITKGGVSFVYDSENRLVKQGNNLEFIYDHTGVSGLIYNSVPYFYRKNVQGDVIGIVDKNGTLVVKYVYDAWGCHKIFDVNGNVITSSSNIGIINPIRYRSYYYDSEINLYFLQSRYYDPETGRFISPDALEYLQPETINGLNLYCYCLNNPVMYSDGSGHAPEWLQVAGWIGLGVGLLLCGVAAGILLGGVGTATLVGAIAVGAAKGTLIGAAVGIGVGAISGGVGAMIAGEQFGSSEFWSDVLFGTFLGFGTGALIGAIAGGFYGANGWYNARALEFTNYGTNDEVVIGKYMKNSKYSYDAIAKSRGSTYYGTSNARWLEVKKMKFVKDKGMWKINKAFLKQQMRAGKNFLITNDYISGYLFKEVSYLTSKGIAIFLV